MHRINQRKRDEWSTVLRPACQHRQPVEADVGGHGFGNRALGDATSTDLEQFETNITSVPQSGRGRGQQLLDQVHEPPDQPHRPFAKRHLRPARGAKQVGDQPEIGPGDVGKQERRPAGRDHASVNFRNLQPRLDASLNSDEVVGAAEVIDEGPKIREGCGHLRDHRSSAEGVQLAAACSASALGP